MKNQKLKEIWKIHTCVEIKQHTLPTNESINKEITRDLKSTLEQMKTKTQCTQTYGIQ